MKRLFNATLYSLAGLRAAWKSESAFRLEVILFIILAPTGIWLGHTGIEQVLLVSSLFIVLIVELLNSSLETTIDRIDSEIHPLSKKAKDIGSAAVFLALLNVAVTWALILTKNIQG